MIMNTKFVSVVTSVVLFLASGLLAVSAQTAVSVTASTSTSPVQIQPGGGNFDVSVEIVNGGAAAESFDRWTIATRPDGSQMNPVGAVDAFSLPGHWSASSRLSYSLGAADPEGSYTYTVAVGVYPSVIASSSVTIEKLPEPPPGGSVGWYSQTSGTTSYLTNVQFVDAFTGWTVGIRNTILHTIDGGDNWYPQVSPVSSNYNDVHFVDSLNGWAVGSGGKVVHTSDGGNTWSAQSSGTSQYINGVFFVDANTGWFVGGKYPGFTSPYQFIYKTDNGGISWQRQLYRANKTPLTKLVFVDKQVGWAVGETSSILHTTNGGASWSEQSSGTTQQLYGIHFISNQTGWIVGRSGTVLYTTNAGETWIAKDTGSSETFSAVSFADSQTGWIVGNNGVVLQTQDGGSSWQAQDSKTTKGLSSVTVIDANTVWAVGLSGSIIHSVSGGN